MLTSRSSRRRFLASLKRVGLPLILVPTGCRRRGLTQALGIELLDQGLKVPRHAIKEFRDLDHKTLLSVRTFDRKAAKSEGSTKLVNAVGQPRRPPRA